MLLITNLNANLLPSSCSYCSCVETEAKAKDVLPLVSLAHQIASKLGYGEMLDEVYVTSVLLSSAKAPPADIEKAGRIEIEVGVGVEAAKVTAGAINNANTKLSERLCARPARPVRLLDLIQEQNPKENRDEEEEEKQAKKPTEPITRELVRASTVMVNCWQPSSATATASVAAAATAHSHRERRELKNLNSLAEEVLGATGISPVYNVAIIPPGVNFQNSTGIGGDSSSGSDASGNVATVNANLSAGSGYNSLPVQMRAKAEPPPPISETAFCIFLGHAIFHYLQDEDVWTALHIVSSLSPLMLEQWD